MAIANFFDKVNLGAAQILKNHDRSVFEAKLLSNCVGLYFGPSALQAYEGRNTLDLLTRLLSRLYPNIKFKSLTATKDELNYIEQLRSMARKINPEINLDDNQEETFLIIVGDVPVNSRSIPTFCVGSDNWNAYHSTTTPQAIGNSQNPFGAAVAACFACSNLFRAMFADELGKPALDENLCFSTFSQTIQPFRNEPELPRVIPINFTLIGAGAIGNAALWALLQLSNVKGRISLIDNEAVSLSNLQRYVLMMQSHVDQPKVDIINEIFKDGNSSLLIEPFPFQWQEVVGSLQPNQLRLLATAIDTKKERLLLQSILPYKIVNAWTSTDCIGVSRHLDFLNDICLSCLYLPNEKEKSESQKIADSLGMGQYEPFFRKYLAKRIPIDEHFINKVHQVAGIENEKLSLYKNQPLQILYSEGICGGRILTVQNDGTVPQDMEVPLAHESALAGVLLAAEIVIEALELREEPIEPLTKLNLMRPLHPYMLERESKSYSGRCICQDEVYRIRYQEKWLGFENKESAS